MNYRHAFHAGGFADVIKHIVLVRILTHLQEKQAAFRVIDSHAGAGVYDLTAKKRAAAASGSPALRGSCRRGFPKPCCRWSRPISTSSAPSIRSAICTPIPARR